MQARYYDPVIGRFFAEDPMNMLTMDMNPGYFNRYAYTMNDPVNLIDPTGMCGTRIRDHVAVSCFSGGGSENLGSDDDGSEKVASAEGNSSGTQTSSSQNTGSNSNNTSTSTGFSFPTLPNIPIPPGVDIKANMLEASRMSPLEFRDAVQNRGKWDFKQQGRQYEKFGNFHYGAVGISNPYFTRKILLKEAGRAQFRDGNTDPSFGKPGSRLNPWGGSGSYADDTNDQCWIDQGITFGRGHDMWLLMERLAGP